MSSPSSAYGGESTFFHLHFTTLPPSLTLKQTAGHLSTGQAFEASSIVATSRKEHENFNAAHSDLNDEQRELVVVKAVGGVRELHVAKGADRSKLRAIVKVFRLRGLKVEALRKRGA